MSDQEVKQTENVQDEPELTLEQEFDEPASALAEAMSLIQQAENNSNDKEAHKLYVQAVALLKEASDITTDMFKTYKKEYKVKPAELKAALND